MDDAELMGLLGTQLDAAPPYIQDFIRSGKFEAFMVRLTSEQAMHADLAGDVSKEILMTLLGMTPLDGLAAALEEEAGAPEEIIGPIIESANREIFVPLRESLKNPQSTQSAPTQALSAPAVPLATAPSYATPLPAPISVSVLPQADNRISQPFVAKAPPEVALPGAEPVSIAQPVAQVQPHTSVHVYLTPPPAAGQPAGQPVVQVRTMATDMEAVKSGHEAQMHAMPGAREVWQPPVQAAPPAPAPVSVPTQQILPPQPAVSPQQAPTPQYTRPYIPPTPRIEPASMTPRNVGGDPYREPVE